MPIITINVLARYQIYLQTLLNQDVYVKHYARKQLLVSRISTWLGPKCANLKSVKTKASPEKYMQEK